MEQKFVLKYLKSPQWLRDIKIKKRASGSFINQTFSNNL